MRPSSKKLFLVLRGAFKPLLLVLGLLIAVFGLRLIGGGHAAARLEDLVEAGGAFGFAVFILLSVVLVGLGLPRQVPAYIGGYAFGLWPGFWLAMLVQFLACAANFYWTRALAHDWAVHRFGNRVRRLDAALAAQPFVTALTLRLMPVGSNIGTNLLAGVSSVPFRPFLAGSMLGFIPQTVIFALIGNGAQISHGWIIGLGAIACVVSALLGLLLLRRHQRLAALAGESGSPA
jgi:uncharacterized membrane protein YdjX (TVP38/TMEM64 family)